MWVWLVAFLAVVALALCIWRYLRRVDTRITAIEVRLGKYARTKKNSLTVCRRILEDIYHLLKKSLTDNDQTLAYKAVELLKLAFGSGVLREDEPIRLAGAVGNALRKNQFDTAGFIMNAFKPLARALPDVLLKDTFEQLTFISITALRFKQGFIIVKAVDHIFLLCGRVGDEADKDTVHAAVHSIRTAGIIALRRHDADLFREINARFISWAAGVRHLHLSAAAAALLVMWMQRITRYDDAALFDYWKETVENLVTEGILENGEIGLLIDECANAAGAAALNPHSNLPVEYITFILDFAAKHCDAKTWTHAVHVTRRIGSLALSRDDISSAFKVVYPLLETGRKLMITELRLWEYSDGKRRKQLYDLLAECILLVELKSRQDMTSSSAEIITEFYRQWIARLQTVGNQKSIKKFCQFFFLYWQKIKKRQAKRSLPLHDDIIQPMLVSEKDRKRLGL
jgi:hypothetical protein